MAKLATMRDLDVWYARMDIEKVLDEIGDSSAWPVPRAADKGLSKVKSRADKALAKAKTRDSMQALEKLTRGGRRRDPVRERPAVAGAHRGARTPSCRASHSPSTFHGLLRSYRSTLQSDRQHLLEQFRFVSIARKVVGVGSVGTRAWVLLLVGSDGTDPLLLQAKEAQASVLERFVGQEPVRQPGGAGGGRPAPHAGLQRHLPRVGPGHRARRRAAGLLPPSAARLEGLGRHRLRWCPRGMAIYGRLCGWTLARAHARSGDRIAIAAYLGSGKSFDNAIASFAETYADQNERDYDALKQAAADGRITVESGL